MRFLVSRVGTSRFQRAHRPGFFAERRYHYHAASRWRPGRAGQTSEMAATSATQRPGAALASSQARYRRDTGHMGAAAEQARHAFLAARAAAAARSPSRRRRPRARQQPRRALFHVKSPRRQKCHFPSRLPPRIFSPLAAGKRLGRRLDACQWPRRFAPARLICRNIMRRRRASSHTATRRKLYMRDCPASHGDCAHVNIRRLKLRHLHILPPRFRRIGAAPSVIELLSLFACG